MATTKTEKIMEDITYASSNQSISRRVIYEFKNLKVINGWHKSNWRFRWRRTSRIRLKGIRR